MTAVKPAILDRAQRLRRTLHSCAETAGQERRTIQELKQFLLRNTSLVLRDCEDGFYAIHKEEAPAKPSIAIRADFDALAQKTGGAAHLCGHDGHAAALAGLALAVEGKRFNRDIYLLFQGAEETGEGAIRCMRSLAREPIDEIYGAHNLPGFAFGKVYSCEGTFALASLGLAVTLTGVGSHAAYPELGVSPAPALGELLLELPRFAQELAKQSLARCTIIGAQLGEEAFGKSPGEAKLWLTLRAAQDAPLDALHERSEKAILAAAARHKLKLRIEVRDPFPATVNDAACARKVLAVCEGAVLAEPMRWSEDFGHYLKKYRGAFFGIGAGEEQLPLHNPGYEYPDALLAPTIEAFLRIIEG